MFKPKRRNIWMGILLGVLILVLVAGASFFVFRSGYQTGSVAAGGEGVLPDFDEVPFYRTHYKPTRGHFSFGGFFIGLLFLVLIVGAIKRMFFFPRRWMMHSQMKGDWSGGPAEWHKKLHEQMEQEGQQAEEPTEPDPEA